MAGRKEFELLFKLQASLGSNFKSSFTDAKTATKDLQGAIKNLRDAAGDIKKFEIQEKQLRASTTAAENNKKELVEAQLQENEFHKSMKNMEDLFTQNKDKWVDEIFTRCTK